MIEEVLDYIHNYFEVKRVRGVFSVIDGTLDGVLFLHHGQFYKIRGSIFNDGIWRYGMDNLPNEETFEGEVWALAVPPRLVALSQEIEEWQEANKAVIQSPYQSESFAGYSYTKASGNGTGGDGGTGIRWQSVFGAQLNQWRKIS